MVRMARPFRPSTTKWIWPSLNSWQETEFGKSLKEMELRYGYWVLRYEYWVLRQFATGRDTVLLTQFTHHSTLITHNYLNFLLLPFSLPSCFLFLDSCCSLWAMRVLTPPRVLVVGGIGMTTWRKSTSFEVGRLRRAVQLFTFAFFLLPFYFSSCFLVPDSRFLSILNTHFSILYNFLTFAADKKAVA